MSTVIGIPFAFRQTAALPITSSTVLVATSLVVPIAIGQTIYCRATLPMTLAGAASGAKFQVVTPAAPTTYQVQYKIFNGSTNVLATAGILLATAAFSNALANAANHFAEVDIFVTNGATAGSVTIQFAQLVSDASAATLLAGAMIKGLYL
jgi:hypothetical protein